MNYEERTTETIARDMSSLFSGGVGATIIYAFAKFLSPPAISMWRRRPWTRPPWQRGRRQTRPQPRNERLGTLWRMMRRRYKDEPDIIWINSKQRLRLSELAKRKMKGGK